MAELALCASAMLLLCACTPADQGAATLDEATLRPTLVIALCDGETVESVSLMEARVDGQVYDVGQTIWRIRRTRPSSEHRFVVGLTPKGFETVQSLSSSSSDWLTIAAELKGGFAGGTNVLFQKGDLEVGVLVDNAGTTSEEELRREARINCSDNPLTALGLPSWVIVAASLVCALVVVGLSAVALARRRRRTGSRPAN